MCILDISKDVSDTRHYLHKFGNRTDAKHMAIFPSIAISSLVIGFNFLADGMREIGLRD